MDLSYHTCSAIRFDKHIVVSDIMGFSLKTTSTFSCLYLFLIGKAKDPG